MDKLHNKNFDFSQIEILRIPLLKNKNVFFLRIFQNDFGNKKKYLINAGIMVEDEIIVANYSDSIHFFEELNLFENGNDQNTYLKIVTKNKQISLKIKNIQKNIYLSKSESRAIYKIYNLSFVGYSLARVLENEFELTPQILTSLLNDANLLD